MFYYFENVFTKMLSVFITILFFHFYINHCYETRWNLQRRAEEKELNLDQTFFGHLKNYQVNAKIVTEEEYPWIARVIHSQKYSKPFICTAICIDDNIFITAARCVSLLKIIYTSLIYQNQRLTAIAFVMPTKESKQLFDDIGFIVVNNEYTGHWHKIETFNEKRPDNVFKWFENMKFKEFEHKVIGYSMKKGSSVTASWKNVYELTELAVIVDIQLCRGILPYNNLIVGFNVPCYHSCPYEVQNKIINNPNWFDERCDNYHGVLGGALINVKNRKLFGVATWAPYSRDNIELPVGFAVPNSESYFEDYACSLKIRNSQTDAQEGFYQKLCDNKRKHDDLLMQNYDKVYDKVYNNWQNFLY